MTLVEKIARALSHAHHGMDTSEASWEAAGLYEGEFSQEDFLGQAMVAIEAMREPTEAMITSWFKYQAAESGNAMWNLMIDAALSEEKT